jgi:phosphoenolpyruvate carboxylase
LRAIPNNAILQQLGFMAITLHGVGRAISKDPELFQAMRERSARFGRSVQMVAAALDRTELDVLRAYVNTLNPAMWLNGAGRARRPARTKALRELARVTGQLDQHDRLARLVRRLQADQLWLLDAIEPAETVQRRRLILLHGIRVAVIQRICLLAMEIPNFSPQLGVTRDDLLARILELDVPSAVERLRRIFPHEERAAGTPDDFGEKSHYRPDSALSYEIERIPKAARFERNKPVQTLELPHGHAAARASLGERLSAPRHLQDRERNCGDVVLQRFPRGCPISISRSYLRLVAQSDS